MPNSPTKGPVTCLADLKGLKAYMQETDVQRAFWGALGANPVPMPVPEVLNGLQRGMLDIYTSTPIFASAAQWSTQTKFWTRSHHTYQPAAVVFDLSWWKGLSDETRKTILGFGPELQKSARNDVRGIDQSILDEFAKNNIKVSDLPPAGREELRKACVDVPATLVKSKVFSQETYDKVVKALAEYRAKKAGK